MTFALLLAVVLDAPLAQSAACTLPPYQAPAEWRACKKDDECTLASDACRMCQDFVPVHKAHSLPATQADLEKRLKARCIKKCEQSCDPRSVEVKCVDGFCAAKRVKVKPQAADAGQ